MKTPRVKNERLEAVLVERLIGRQLGILLVTMTSGRWKKNTLSRARRQIPPVAVGI
jgi:hypothetical protein